MLGLGLAPGLLVTGLHVLWMNEYKDFGFSDKISEYQDSDPLILKLRFIQSLDKDFRNLTMPLYCA